MNFYQTLSQHEYLDTSSSITAQKDGVKILPKFFSDEILDEYVEYHQKTIGEHGWPFPCPYLKHHILKDICLNPKLMHELKTFTGYQMGLHLNLTGFVSTQRAWHSDSYLNPENVKDRYCAVWIACEDIHPDSGPFQYIVGSHKWPVIKRNKLFDIIPREQSQKNDWPSTTENIVSDACAKEIMRREAEIVTYLPKKGDVLIWHANLIHRGSIPTDTTIRRRALIAHYSSIAHRPDMPSQKKWVNDEVYFYFGEHDHE
jgi:ectoine hydroxylase-related dioxygenase (phytanoyl-CoA dioxygenase family)